MNRRLNLFWRFPESQSNAKEASGKGNKNKLETVGPLARRYGSNMQGKAALAAQCQYCPIQGTATLQMLAVSGVDSSTVRRGPPKKPPSQQTLPGCLRNGNDEHSLCCQRVPLGFCGPCLAPLTFQHRELPSLPPVHRAAANPSSRYRVAKKRCPYIPRSICTCA